MMVTSVEIELERRRAGQTGRPTAMSGHHPWSELTKHFTAEDWEVVEAGAAEVVADSDRRERLEQRPAAAAPKPPLRTRPAPPAGQPAGRTDPRSRP